MTVRVRSVGNPESLAKTAYDLAKTPVAERKYLSHDELEKQHGASQEDLDKIEHFAQQHDLTVVYRSAPERCVVLKGKLGDLLSAFHADVQIYHHSTGTYRGRRGEITMPSELSGIVTGVFGFDNRPKRREPTRKKARAQDGPGGDNGLAATDFATRYNFPVNQNGDALDGAGQTIAIIELGGGYRNSDLQIFFREIGVATPKVSSISVDHVGNDPTTPDSADGEVMLDIEVAGAVAPKAKIAVYFAPNNGDQGFINAISAAVHDKERKPGVISISWASPEMSTDSQGLAAYHELFAAAGALGITVCAASGDHGSAGEAANNWDGKIHVLHPACDDLVLACGGTQIENDHDVVWNDGTPFDVNVQGGGGWATGGGISTAFAVPSYQTGLNLPNSLDTGKPGRGVPDIAMSATNYFTRVELVGIRLRRHERRGAVDGSPRDAAQPGDEAERGLPKPVPLRERRSRSLPRRNARRKRDHEHGRRLRCRTRVGRVHGARNAGRIGDPRRLARRSAGASGGKRARAQTT